MRSSPEESAAPPPVIRRIGPAFVAWLAVLASTGPAAWAEAPRVARLRIPAAKVADWFPAGTPLRMIEPSELEGLLEAAGRGGSIVPAGREPRLVRASHHACWDGKSLVGRSELLVDRSGAVTPALALDPWTPAIRRPDDAAPPVGALATGQAVALLPPATTTRTVPTAAPSDLVRIVLDWEQRALAESEDRGFALGLPGDESSVLTIELPAEWAPIGPVGPRKGPLPASGPGDRAWAFHGRPGLVNLRIVGSRADQGVRGGGLVWVSGDTRIDLGPEPRIDPRAANWRTEWTVQPDPRGSMEFSAELDPGLDLIDVVGPGLKEHQVSRTGDRTRVHVRLSQQPRPATQVVFVAHARVPVEGRWNVPAIRPIDAIWTGGNTIVRLDSLRVLEGCRERAGRRVPAPAEGGEADVLVFEAESPNSVAELDFTLRRPRPTCRLLGRLKVNDAVASLECQINGLDARGGPTEIEADLSAGWTPGRVSWGGADQALSWSYSPRPGGGTRLRVLIPASDASSAPPSLTIEATSSSPPGRDPLPLPRVRPLGAAILDEAWLALVDPGTRLIPTQAKGLSWIDHERYPGLTGANSPRAGLHPEIAWRWVGDDGEAFVRRDRIAPEARTEITTLVRIDQGGQRLRIEGEIETTGTVAGAHLPVWIGTGVDADSAWAFLSDEGATIAARPLTTAERKREGLPESGTAWSLERPGSADATPRVRFRAAPAWQGQGAIPLINVPARLRPRANVLVEVPRDLPTSVKTAGLSRLDSQVAERLAEPWRRNTAGDWSAIAHALSYRDARATLFLSTTSLPATETNGIVRDANLTTLAYPDGPRLNRLRLLAQVEAGRELSFQLPAGISLLRAAIDGENAAVLSRDGRLSLLMPAAAGSPRPRTVDLDFEDGTALTGGGTIRPLMPVFDLPCLSFSWEVVAPPGRRVAGATGYLVAAEPEVVPSWPFGALGFPSLPWRARQGTTAVVAESTWKRLDEILTANPAQEMSFSAWFIRWDSTSTPVLIDRVSLAAAGYGPRSRCDLSRDPSGISTSQRSLERHGLAVIPVDGTLIVTTAAASREFEAGRSWNASVGEALLWGSDRSDRLQSVARWRGEFTPVESASDLGRPGLRPPPGWSSWHLACVSWPSESAGVVIRDDRSASLPRWIAAAMVAIVLCLLVVRLSPRRALVLPTLLLALSVLGRLWLGRDPYELLAGAFFGSAVGLLVSLGRTITLQEFRRSHPTRQSASHVGIRLTRSMARVAPAATALAFLLGAAAVAGRDDGPIPILLPYEGSYEPGRPPTRAILRLSDLDTLKRLARVESRSEPPPLVLVDATHRVSWQGAREVSIASELVILKRDGAPGRWSIPIAGCRDIGATIDGKPVPVFIEAGGTRAEVDVTGAGRHDLTIRRSASLSPTGGAEGVDIPVNPHPSARVVVGRPLAGGTLRLPNLRGKSEKGDEGATLGSLGPSDRFEIRLGDPGKSAPQAAGTNMEGLLLYDIQPAGDRLRARFTYRGSSPLAQLGFLMDPALIPRSTSIPGLVSESWGGTEEEPVWTARMDPPLRDGAVIELDLWRPRTKSRPSVPDAAGDEGSPVETGRDYPRLEPLQVDRYSGALGVRRPGHWTGRVEPLRGEDPLSDEGFVKLWGPLPDDRLTLCGTTRLGRDDRPEYRTGPAIVRVRVRPALNLTVQEGRILASYEAELGDFSDAVDHLTVSVPRELKVDQVECDGLTAWSRTAPDSLMLRYDRPLRATRRKLAITGWIPALQDPMVRGGRSLRMPTPWIALPGMESLPGKLVLTSDVRVDIEAPRDAVSRTAPAPSPANPAAPAPTAQLYQVDDAARLGTLTWIPAPPQVEVRIESQMTIGPDAAEWVAVLRYSVRGGPIESLRLRIPQAWAAVATASMPGNELRRTSEERGSNSIWTLTPARPVWGTQRLVVRSSQPLSPGQEIQHPEVIPLGVSSVATNLALVHAIGSTLTTAGSSTFQQVAYAGRFADEEFRTLPGTQARAFHVERDNWSLRVQVPASPAERQDEADPSARVVSADVDLTILPDGSARGRSVVDVLPRTGRFLTVELDAGGQIPWTTVDQVPVRPLRGGERRWLIPLRDSAGPHVAIYWTVPPPASPTGEDTADLRLAIPTTGPDRVPARVTVHLADGMAVRSLSTDLDLTVADRVILDRAERIGRELMEFLIQMDRGSGRDREKVAGLLIAHELNLRAAERSIRWSSRHLPSDRRDRAERDLAEIQASRRLLIEGLKAAALDDEIAAALSYLGQDETPASTAISVAEPAIGDRIRGLGRMSFLIGMAPGIADEPASLTISRGNSPAVSEGETADRARSLLMLVVLAAIGLAAIVRARPGAWGLFILGAMLGLLAFAGGLLPTAAGLVATVAGWSSRKLFDQGSAAPAETSAIRTEGGGDGLPVAAVAP
ncbi:hypothetical protein [Aquisphaera insulae]|uniref:hypothetical protein n=1 Tax=Aquisphaera insulae TaxID=2712864 RepID=UPI0013EB0100|nr:hypothetical protein [Aquisphaera insulae]